MKTVVLACVLFLIGSLHAAAQEDPCPFYDGRRIFKDWRPLSQLLIANAYRKECGVASDADKAALHSIHEARGCPSESGVGRYFTDILEAPITEETAHPALAEIRHRDPVGYYRFCRMAEIIQWPEEDASFLLQPKDELTVQQLTEYQAFWSHLEAMQGVITERMMGLGGR